MATQTCMPDTVISGSEARRPAQAVLRGYGSTIFLSALLLFLVQLVLGKYLLPFFGGTPSVWNTCMLFFQTLLLFGYGYAHFLSLRKNLRLQARFHSVLLLVSLALLFVHWMRLGSPITSGNGWKPHTGSNPVWGILEFLCVTVGLPFFLLSSSAPLLQKWFSKISSGTTPYWLYALSNGGSLLGLLSYPFFFEWTLTIKHQAQFWFAGYALFVLLCLVIARTLRADVSSPEDLEEPASLLAIPSERPSAARYLLWVALATCSSTMLLATTNLLCQDVAVIPLLWVWPLSIYLLSFILVFGRGHWYTRRIFWPLYFISLGAALKVSLLMGLFPKMPMQLATYSLALFAVCMVCHGELALSKPDARHLTSFYLMVALGGALGGIFVVLLAPQIFRGFAEFQTALLGCGFLLIAAFFEEGSARRADVRLWALPIAVLIVLVLPQVLSLSPRLASLPVINNESYIGTLVLGFLLVRWRWQVWKGSAIALPESSSFWQPLASLGLLGLLALAAYVHSSSEFPDLIFQQRNFFGVKYVRESQGRIYLLSGSILHGGENSDPRTRDIPTLYFSRTSGIGMLLSNFPRGTSGQDPIRVGVIGLGAGTLAAYGKSGDYFRFYEIDPGMIRISAGAHPFFHFVEDSKASVQVVEGDGRLSVMQEADHGDLQRFDVFIADGFSGDAVPVHLLTREAMQIYLRHLRGPDSVVAFNISNHYLDLAPVVAGLAQSYHLHSTRVCDGYSVWVLLARNPAMLKLANLPAKSTPVLHEKSPLLWTDDYSNLFQVMQLSSSACRDSS